jgi:predicted nucleic acid-binding protein
MIVVSDTSVITNLIQLNQLTLLKDLFGNIVIPQKVFEELKKVPKQIDVIEKLNWIEVKQISDRDHFDKLLKILDPGEAEAIVLAIELKADALLIDEKKGRKIAQEHGIIITGLLGILIDAKAENFIREVKPILDKLIFETGFRISPKLYQDVLKKVNE